MKKTDLDPSDLDIQAGWSRLRRHIMTGIADCMVPPGSLPSPDHLRAATSCCNCHNSAKQRLAMVLLGRCQENRRKKIAKGCVARGTP